MFLFLESGLAQGAERSDGHGLVHVEAGRWIGFMEAGSGLVTETSSDSVTDDNINEYIALEIISVFVSLFSVVGSECVDARCKMQDGAG